MALSGLIKYLPNQTALDWVLKWTKNYSVLITVTKERKGKLGDYRRATLFGKHRISINYNLGEELFFLTLTHEIAHMHAFVQYKLKKIQPHGKEWKQIYSNLILDSLDAYSPELQKLLLKFAKNPKAGYFSDPSLVNYFSKQQGIDGSLLKNLAIGSRFYFEKKPFELLEKRRTRYLCKDLITHKKYLINQNVAVTQ